MNSVVISYYCIYFVSTVYYYLISRLVKTIFFWNVTQRRLVNFIKVAEEHGT
jgi:hypothetical protein